MSNFVVTVARGFGSGGKEIATTLAERLGIHSYENRILTLASQLAGLDEKVFSEINERLRPVGFSGLLTGLPKRRRVVANNEKFVSDERLFGYQSEIILNLAATESCVIVGKCADWILRNHDNVLSVYVEAPRDFCYRRIMQQMGVSAETSHSSIAATDKYRAEYYKHYTGGNYWTNPVNYDITLNSERLGIENCVSVIIDSLRHKFPHISFPETPVVTASEEVL